MTDPAVPPVAPPADPPAPAPAPATEPKPAEKKLLDDLKRAQAKAKELETKLAEALPYVEKFRGHDEAKAIEAQREAEARAKQEADSRASRELGLKRENAQLRAIAGVVPPKFVNYAMYLLNEDQTIAHDPETGAFTGLSEAVARIMADEAFVSVKPGEPPKKPAPGLPVRETPTLPDKIASITSLLQLQAMPMEFQMEFTRTYPDRYAELRSESRASLARPLPPPPPPMAQPYRAPITVPSARK